MSTTIQSTKARSLSDTQLVILAAAGQRDDGRILPVPDSVKTRGSALQRCLASLASRGLADEAKAGRTDKVWRTNETGQSVTLVLSKAGAAALGLDDSKQQENEGASSIDPSPPTPSARPSTKAAAVLELLGKADGATLAELETATGWQPHSVRGFLSGTVRKKMGLTLISQRTDGVRRYRIERLAQ